MEQSTIELYETESLLNPWRSIWTQPRATIRQIVKLSDKRYLTLLISIGGFYRVLDRALDREEQTATLGVLGILAIALLFGPIGGQIYVRLYSAYMALIAKIFKINVSSENILKAMAWSFWPQSFAIPFAIVSLLTITGSLSFLTSNLEFAVDIFALVAIIFFEIWAFVVFAKCLGEIFGTSAWKAFGVLTTGFLIFAIPVGAIIALGIYLN